MSSMLSESISPIAVTGHEGQPKYLLLRNALAAQILEGRWKAGSQLPAEEQLAALTSLSLGTVQRSLRMLVDEGRLVRRHGIGTFVADEHVPMGGPFRHFRFLEESTGEILPIFTRVVARYKASEPGTWSRLVKAVQPVCIDRLFSINREFDVFVRLYFDAQRFPELAKIEKTRLNGVSFKDLIERKYHQPAAGYTQNMRVTALPSEVCAALKLKPRAAGCVLEIVANDRAGQAMYVQDAYIPPNGRKLLISP